MILQPPLLHGRGLPADAPAPGAQSGVAADLPTPQALRPGAHQAAAHAPTVLASQGGMVAAAQAQDAGGSLHAAWAERAGPAAAAAQQRADPEQAPAQDGHPLTFLSGLTARMADALADRQTMHAVEREDDACQQQQKLQPQEAGAAAFPSHGRHAADSEQQRVQQQQAAEAPGEAFPSQDWPAGHTELLQKQPQSSALASLSAGWRLLPNKQQGPQKQREAEAPVETQPAGRSQQQACPPQHQCAGAIPGIGQHPAGRSKLQIAPIELSDSSAEAFSTGMNEEKPHAELPLRESPSVERPAGDHEQYPQPQPALGIPAGEVNMKIPLPLCCAPVSCPNLLVRAAHAGMHTVVAVARPHCWSTCINVGLTRTAWWLVMASGLRCTCALHAHVCLWALTHAKSGACCR